MREISSRIRKDRKRTVFFTVMVLMIAMVFGAAGPVYAKSKKKKKKVKYKYTVTIAHARCDEKGRGSWASVGSKAGDQTKREVCMEPLGCYNHWSYVARPKSSKAAKIIAKQAVYGCKNNKIGYGKDEPSLSSEALKANYKLNKIKKKVYTDCFMFVHTCCAAAGIEASPIHLDEEPSEEEKASEESYGNEETVQHSYDVFTVLRDKAHRGRIKPEKLKTGDVLVRLTKKQRHAAIVCKVKKTKIR